MQLRRFLRITVTSACLLLCTAGFAAGSFAQSAHVTIGVGDTILAITGNTSPHAFVTISRNNTVIATTTADNAGAFSHTLNAQTPGLQTIAIFAHSTAGKTTDTVEATVHVQEHATTTAYFFLPPTINLQNPTITTQNDLTAQGETGPFNEVILYINNTVFSTVTADANGNWQADINVMPLANGVHTLFVRAHDTLGNQSYPSAARTFTIARPTPPGPTPTPQPQPIPTPAPHTPIPATPHITSPKNNTTVNDKNTTIEGTGPPHTQIEIWNGDQNLGSVWTDAQGKWRITLQLEPGEYALRAKACSYNGICSPFSDTIAITYQPHAPISPLDRPLRIFIPQSSFTIFTGDELHIRHIALNGTPFYDATIHWGDGKTTTLTNQNDNIYATYTYTKAGKYTIKATIKDSQGRTNTIYTTAHVVSPSTAIQFPILLILPAIALCIICIVTWRIVAHRKAT